jgi:hypothetical protein
MTLIPLGVRCERQSNIFKLRFAHKPLLLLGHRSGVQAPKGQSIESQNTVKFSRLRLADRPGNSPLSIPAHIRCLNCGRAGLQALAGGIYQGRSVVPYPVILVGCVVVWPHTNPTPAESFWGPLLRASLFTPSSANILPENLGMRALQTVSISKSAKPNPEMVVAVLTL